MFIADFLDHLFLEKKYSKYTLVAYRSDIEAFLAFYKEVYQEVDISKASYGQIRAWIVSLVAQKFSNKTVNRKVSSLKAYYRFLLKIECIKKNPLAHHTRLKVAKKLQIPFSTKEIEDVLQCLNQEKDFISVRDRLIIELFYTTGIRRSELINLKIRDVDLVNRQIKVLGKRNKERFIPLLPGVCDSIVLYQEFRKDFIDNQDVSFLFITKKGVKIYETLVYRIINNYFSKASSKIKKSPHILRHSFATHLLNEGADLNAVKELLGHSSLAATEVYTQHSVTQLAKVYEQSHPRNLK